MSSLSIAKSMLNRSKYERPTKAAERSGRLDDALHAWLKPYNFPAEIEQGFAIDFLSGGENIVTYNGRGEFEENQLEDLIGKSYEEIIEIFNC